MNRMQFESWLASHPDSVVVDPRQLLDRCEVEVGEHAHELAWRHAGGVAVECLHRFERAFGLPASETFVAKEVCSEVARELRQHGPHVDRVTEEEWLSRAVLGALGREARSPLRSWLVELAEQEEQAAWQEIVRFTKRAARDLIAEARLSDRLEWDLDRSYPRVARRVIEMLIREFDQRGHRASHQSLPWDAV